MMFLARAVHLKPTMHILTVTNQPFAMRQAQLHPYAAALTCRLVWHLLTQ
jgi:hypothetical protein